MSVGESRESILVRWQSMRKWVVLCSKLIFHTCARNRGDSAKETATRWRKRRKRTDGSDGGWRRGEERAGGWKGERAIAAEQKLKRLHPWQNQQPVDANSRLARYRDGNKVTKKSCYRSMEHHSRGVRATRQPRANILRPETPRITCARATANVRRIRFWRRRMFCSTRRPSTKSFKSLIPVTSP